MAPDFGGALLWSALLSHEYLSKAVLFTQSFSGMNGWLEGKANHVDPQDAFA